MESESLYTNNAGLRSACMFLLILFLFTVCMSACQTMYFPKEGNWYCEELGVMLNFETGENGRCKEGYAIVDGQRISVRVGWENQGRYQDVIYVTCDPEECPRCETGDDHYVFKYLSLDDQQMKLKEYNQRIVYTFYRVE